MKPRTRTYLEQYHALDRAAQTLLRHIGRYDIESKERCLASATNMFRSQLTAKEATKALVDAKIIHPVDLRRRGARLQLTARGVAVFNTAEREAHMGAKTPKRKENPNEKTEKSPAAQC